VLATRFVTHMIRSMTSPLDRRTLLAASGAALLTPAPLFAQEARFDWNALVTMAQKLGRAPFAETPLHPGAAKVDYDALHQAKFRDDRTLWGNLPGDVAIRFFPLSANAAQPVTIAIVENGRARPLPYDPTMFDAPEGNAVRTLGAGAGFAGFRVMNAARDGDWLSFLGASYFRAPAPNRQFGLSARAIAINTSIAGKEEFPRFTHFWLERTGASALTVYALLDGASVTGAYRFDNRLTPQGVVQEVTAALFPRRPIQELGLMPMTSMFWYDQSRRVRTQDWRPEVHDSDILSIASADGTAHARPLFNPDLPETSAFAETSPKGFGLLQRDRNFDHYQDDGVFYERRPSLWATAQADFGAGEVRLYEFPTDSEYTDNVCAYWTPATAPRPGRRIDARYRLDWTESGNQAGAQTALLDTIWRGAGENGAERLVLDFAGVPADLKPDIWVDVKGGAVAKQAGYFVQGRPNMFRVVIDVTRNGPADLRAQLRAGNRTFSEYVHYPLRS
jgi:glucans biosynthesis protein